MEATYLLVHGAWHGAWAWQPLVHELESAGATVQTVDLPSSGEDAASLGNLEADTAVVREALDAIEGSAVLVGHSYGGMPISQASAGRDDVSHLVYVCAFLLPVGASLQDALGGELPDWFELTEDGTAVRAQRPREIFYADVDEELAAASEARLGLQSLASFGDPLGVAGYEAIPSTYLLCEEDRAIPPDAQERMAQAADHVHRLPTSHSPFLVRPQQVAELLLGVQG